MSSLFLKYTQYIAWLIVLFSIILIALIFILVIWQMLPIDPKWISDTIITIMVIGGLSLIIGIATTLMREEIETEKPKNINGKPLIG